MAATATAGRPRLAGDGQTFSTPRTTSDAYKDAANTTQQAVPQQKSWAHFVAGGYADSISTYVTMADMLAVLEA